jgi:hypothetical protein
LVGFHDVFADARGLEGVLDRLGAEVVFKIEENH